MPRRKSGQSIAVTLEDVAEAAGVSRSTASRAFSRPEMLRPETVDRVHAVAARMGYAVNHVARALSTGRFGNIAVVVPDIGNAFFPPLVRVVESRADDAGFAVFLGDSDESPDREATLVGRLSPQVDGFVLASSRMTDEKIREFAATRPLVLINRDLPGISRVLIDITGGMAEAFGHLTQLGHRRIAYVAGPADSWSDQERRRAVMEIGVTADVEVTVLELGRPDYHAARNVVSELLASDATAAIAFDDVVAQGLLAGLAVRGLSVPQDFSVVGCDDIVAATTHPPLTTISAGSAAAGRAAVDLLLRHLADDADTEERIVIGTHLVIRATADRAVARTR